MSPLEIPVSSYTGWLQSLPEFFLILFLFVSNIIENIFPPWPADMITVFAGFLSSSGSLSFFAVILSSVLGNFAGGVIMYHAGMRVLNYERRLNERLHPPPFLSKIVLEYMDPAFRKKAEQLFQHYGLYFVLFSRFFPGIRFFVSIIAGLYGMERARFATAFLGGVILWTLLLGIAGYFLGLHWEKALEWVRVYNLFVILLFAVALALYGSVHFYKKRRR